MSTIDNNGMNGHRPPPRIGFEDIPRENATDGSNNQYRKPPTEYVTPVWHLGWTDGRYGQPIGINEEALKTQVTLDWLERTAAAEKRIALTRADAEYWDNQVQHLNSLLASARQHFTKLAEHRKENYQEYSFLLAAIYLVFAFIMILADIPLSLRLVALGFNVDTEFKIDPKDPKSTVYRVGDLLNHPQLVAQHLWEALLLALGIACAGIFIKFFLDTFILRDRNKPAPTRQFKFAMIFVFVLFLSTNFVLGIFRARMQDEVNSMSINKQVDEIYTKRMNLNIPANRDVIRREVEASTRRENPWALPTFILLTLLLPIIGGICFSEGWRKLENAKHFNFAKLELWKYERKYKRISLAWRKSQNELSALQAQHDRDNSNLLWKNSVTDLQLSVYRHGYARGLNVPETIDANESLYERCEKSVARLFAKKLRTKSWDNTPPRMS